jgi:hypothetical protein
VEAVEIRLPYLLKEGHRHSNSTTKTLSKALAFDIISVQSILQYWEDPSF